jgi:hypothetical protein
MINKIFNYAKDMKLFLLVHGFHYCLKIPSDLNKLAVANALELNVSMCKSITFSRLRHPAEFPYMLGGVILDRVDSISDLESYWTAKCLLLIMSILWSKKH